MPMPQAIPVLIIKAGASATVSTSARSSACRFRLHVNPAIDGKWQWGGLYDLRLRIAEHYPIVRIPEPLYSAAMIGYPANW